MIRQKLQKMGNRTFPGHPGDLQNVDAKLGHRHHRRADILDKIQDVVL
jgi:hypothetical protein